MQNTSTTPATAEVINLADRRKALAADKPIVSSFPERTPELAFVLAIVDALPNAARRKVRATIMDVAEVNPDCEAAQQAANLAFLLTIKKA